MGNSINGIEVNNRYKREVNMIFLKSDDRNIFLFPIKDKMLDCTFYYLYKNYQSILIFGPEIEHETIDLGRSQTFVSEHNRYMMENIIKHKDIKDDPLGNYSEYYYIDGLIVFKDAIRKIRENHV